jgi:hypothetical protein
VAILAWSGVPFCSHLALSLKQSTDFRPNFLQKLQFPLNRLPPVAAWLQARIDPPPLNEPHHRYFLSPFYSTRVQIAPMNWRTSSSKMLQSRAEAPPNCSYSCCDMEQSPVHAQRTIIIIVARIPLLVPAGLLPLCMPESFSSHSQMVG